MELPLKKIAQIGPEEKPKQVINIPKSFEGFKRVIPKGKRMENLDTWRARQNKEKNPKDKTGHFAELAVADFLARNLGEEFEVYLTSDEVDENEKVDIVFGSNTKKIHVRLDLKISKEVGQLVSKQAYEKLERHPVKNCVVYIDPKRKRLILEMPSKIINSLSGGGEYAKAIISPGINKVMELAQQKGLTDYYANDYEN